jgi:ribosomal-protein-alanine N-acetyltransferase
MSPMLRQRRPPSASPRGGQITLSPPSLPARARACPGDDTMAQIAILDGLAVPSPHHFHRWGTELAAHGFTSMRTGALSTRQALQAEQAGLRCVQELALLDMAFPGAQPAPSHRTRRMSRRDLVPAAAVDLAAFGLRWSLDAAMLGEVQTATPMHRARVVRDPAAMPVAGFLVSGRAGRAGYIQRLAVHPDAQRRGIGSALLVDALRWLRRARVQQVFVNTHVENEAALLLYRAHGFRELPERLRVYEGPIAP